ncbi:MAG: FKBP-type peptidyl-prolyl cis-trans isomerase [Acidobacteria bacterium]|nr:FKBP-type peptidyl-prolyl cis-trans isomerase [Acidobacteriota bacterium]MDA1236083.1 FKBP-type peptidyl-prolyl cis-trans isomerase [Acidobacteriota bacterium]
MTEAKSGDTVKVHYTGTLEDDTVFDSSRERDPLEFKLGANMVVPGFENLVVGLKEGETAKETIPCTQAYGERRDELQLEVKRDNIPADLDLSVGMHLQMQSPDGQSASVEVVELSDDTVKLDANHPLSGKDLTFEVELVELNPAD